MGKIAELNQKIAKANQPRPIDKGNELLYSSLNELMNVLAKVNESISGLSDKIDQFDRDIEVNVPPLDLSGIEKAISSIKKEDKPVNVKFKRDSEGKITGFTDA